MRTNVIIAATLTLDAVFFVLNISVAAVGGSRAVLSQAVYTISDLVGTGMILLGQRESVRPATPRHPFGRGKERFFWAFVAGLLTFSLAGSLVLGEGLLQILTPKPVAAISDGLLTIAGTLAANLGSLVVVLWELRRDGQTVEGLLASEHQGVKSIFLQDTVAVAGAAVAFSGLFLVRITGNALYDGLSAAVVGALLLLTGFVLAAEARSLLVGRSVSDEEGREILRTVEQYPFVRKVVDMRSMVLGPEEALVTLQVNFLDELNTDDIEMHIDQLQRFIRGEHPRVRHLVIQPVSAPEEPHRPRPKGSAPLPSGGSPGSADPPGRGAKR